MNLANSIPEPFRSHLKFIHERISSSGYECYLVGGSVRDLYMNKTPGEYDLTTSARPETIKSLFKSVIETGIKHGTVTILLDKTPYEITTYRVDRDYTDGRHPDKVEFGTSLVEDLNRRDFTMNALALDIATGEIIDQHNGRVDIDNHLIRTIGNPIHRFTEDGLRPIRALRFASVLNFKIDIETKHAIQATKKITAKISVERLQDEITKSLRGKNPSTMIKLLVEEDILPLFLKDFPSLTTVPLNEMDLNNLDRTPKSILGFQIGIWCYSLCPTVPIIQWESWLQKLKFSNVIIKDAIFQLTLITLSKDVDFSLSDYQIRKTFLSPIKKHINQRNLEFNSVWEVLTVFSWQWLAKGFELWTEAPPLLLSDLVVNGKYLEIHFPSLPKPRYGELLSVLLDHVLQMPENNEISFLNAQCVRFLSKL